MTRPTPTARHNALRACAASALGGLVVVALSACGGNPSKAQALEVVQRDVKEDASCTLPVATLTELRMQHSSKGVCVPREAPNADKTVACLEALAALGATSKKDAAYMREWPDELSGASLEDVPGYERRSRELAFKGCFELVGDLREGRFSCGKARASKVASIAKKDDKHASVRYARELLLDAKLEAADAACGPITRPPGESTVALIENETGGWAVEQAAPAAP